MLLVEEAMLLLVVLLAGVLAFYFFKMAREDPDLWIYAPTKKRFIKVANFPERLQPEENKPLLDREKKEEN